MDVASSPRNNLSNWPKSNREVEEIKRVSTIFLLYAWRLENVAETFFFFAEYMIMSILCRFTHITCSACNCYQLLCRNGRKEYKDTTIQGGPMKTN